MQGTFELIPVLFRAQADPVRGRYCNAVRYGEVRSGRYLDARSQRVGREAIPRLVAGGVDPGMVARGSGRPHTLKDAACKVEPEASLDRSEERRVGKECVKKGRSRGWPEHEKKN